MAKQTTLTEKSIERLAKAPDGTRYERYDRLQPGLALRVTDKGSKSFSVYYYYNGRHRRLTLGRWPTLKVDEARRQAHEARESAAAGVDPKAERERQRQRARADEEAGPAVRTFGDLAELYIARQCPRLVNGSDVESVIRRRLMPAWGDRPVEELRKRDAIRLLDRLVDEGPGSGVLTTYRAIKRVFSWGAKRDEIETDPMANLQAPVEEKRRQVALHHQTIRVLWHVWTEQGYPFGDLYKLLLLTGQRRGEAAKMAWSELVPADAPKLWIIPAERTKSRREHKIPLSEEVQQLLAEIPRGTEGPYVFSTTAGRRPVSGFSKSAGYTHRLAREKAEEWGVEIQDDWVVHDLRRTVRTEMARLNVPEQVAERVLNHSAEPLVQTYNVYSYDAEKAEALERWAIELKQIINPNDPQNVVPLARS